MSQPPGSTGQGPRAQQAGGLPKRFGKYTLLRQLATGGMAELFLALHRSVAGFEKLVVIKRILPSMNRDKAFIDMLLHEARIAATLSHPNVVQIFDVGFVDGTYYIAMEHINGEDLRSIVRQMKRVGLTDFPLEYALSIALGICSGLSYAHEKKALDGAPLNIVHRDVSPQNVLVTFAGDVKVVDFGIAKSGSHVGEDTRQGRLKGKVPYMSPEQARGEQIDSRSDLFATGIILFELTTGRRLFKGSGDLDTLRLICDREYPFPSQIRPDYPPRLEVIVMRALAKDRDERYRTAREMQADLEAYIRDERIPVSSIDLSRWMETLFADRMALQKEALQDVKQLADIIAAQTLGEGTTDSVDLNSHSGNSIFPSASGASTTVSLPPPRSKTKLWAAGLLVAMTVVGGGAFAVVRALEPAAAQAPAPSTATVGEQPMLAHGSLRLDTDPDQASIWINGSLRSERTPATITQLPLRTELSIKLTKDGYAPVVRTITLAEAKPDEHIEAKLTTGTVVLEIKTSTPFARYFVDNKAIEGPRIEGLSPNVEHRLVVTAPGYAPKTTMFMAGPNETKTLTMELERDPTGGKAGAVGVSTAAPASKGSGKLNVGSRGGFCDVSVGGRAHGPTPVGGIVLPVGNHVVTCRGSDGRSLSMPVRIEADQTSRLSFNLGK